MPTPMAIPPKLSILSVMSKTCMMRNTCILQTGMEIAITAVAPRSRRKRKSTIAANRTPKMIFWMVFRTERSIKSL